MKQNLTEVVFILDRSGSMSGLELETIKGYNNLLKEQKQVDGEALISTVLFDDKYQVIHHRVDIRKIKELTQEDYYVRGSTALYDAVGKTMDDLGRVLSLTSEENRPSKVLFVIITDGMENASSEYNANQIRKMIKHQKEVYNWQFVFLGANLDAQKYAESIGIDRKSAATYENSKDGVERNYAVVNHMISNFRKNKNLETDYLEKIKKS